MTPDLSPPSAEIEIGRVMRSTSRMMDRSEYSAAREYLLQILPLMPRQSGELLFRLAEVETALSNYDAAKEWLRTASREPALKSRALADEAEVAWRLHQYEEGCALAIDALRDDPLNRKAQIMRDRCMRPLSPLQLKQRYEGKRLAHAAFYVTTGGNFGDAVLPLAVRAAFESIGQVDHWVPFHVHQIFGSEQVQLANRTDGLIVGGGGLFLPDTAPNGNSGWQWNVTPKSLRALKCPLAVYAVGFNLFHGQRVGKLFKRSLVALVEQAAVIGLRNHGSIDKVKELLPSELAEKISYAPCPTTVLGKLRGESACQHGETVLINIAYDRSQRRFDDGYAQFLDQMAIFIRSCQRQGRRLCYAAHLPADERFVSDLKKNYQLDLEIFPLYAMPVEDAYAVYRKAGLVIGMRGHASMIPFGLGTPIISLISHPKMKYFLDDIGRSEWGLDVSQPDLADRLSEIANDMLERQEIYRSDIDRLQIKLLAHVQTVAKSFETAMVKLA